MDDFKASNSSVVSMMKKMVQKEGISSSSASSSSKHNKHSGKHTFHLFGPSKHTGHHHPSTSSTSSAASLLLGGGLTRGSGAGSSVPSAAGSLRRASRVGESLVAGVPVPSTSLLSLAKFKDRMTQSGTKVIHSLKSDGTPGSSSVTSSSKAPSSSKSSVASAMASSAVAALSVSPAPSPNLKRTGSRAGSRSRTPSMSKLGSSSSGGNGGSEEGTSRPRLMSQSSLTSEQLTAHLTDEEKNILEKVFLKEEQFHRQSICGPSLPSVSIQGMDTKSESPFISGFNRQLRRLSSRYGSAHEPPEDSVGTMTPQGPFCTITPTSSSASSLCSSLVPSGSMGSNIEEVAKGSASSSRTCSISVNGLIGACRVCRKVIDQVENYHYCDTCNQPVCEDCSCYSSIPQDQVYICNVCRRRRSTFAPLDICDVGLLQKRRVSAMDPSFVAEGGMSGVGRNRQGSGQGNNLCPDRYSADSSKSSESNGTNRSRDTNGTISTTSIGSTVSSASASPSPSVSPSPSPSPSFPASQYHSNETINSKSQSFESSINYLHHPSSPYHQQMLQQQQQAQMMQHSMMTAIRPTSPQVHSDNSLNGSDSSTDTSYFRFQRSQESSNETLHRRTKIMRQKGTDYLDEPDNSLHNSSIRRKSASSYGSRTLYGSLEQPMDPSMGPSTSIDQGLMRSPPPVFPVLNRAGSLRHSGNAHHPALIISTGSLSIEGLRHQSMLSVSANQLVTQNQPLQSQQQSQQGNQFLSGHDGSEYMMRRRSASPLPSCSEFTEMASSMHQMGHSCNTSPRQSLESDMLQVNLGPILGQRRSIPSVMIEPTPNHGENSRKGSTTLDANCFLPKDHFVRRLSTGRALPKIPIEQCRSLLDLPQKGIGSTHSLDIPCDQPRRASAPEGADHIRIVIDDVDSSQSGAHLPPKPPTWKHVVLERRSIKMDDHEMMRGDSRRGSFDFGLELKEGKRSDSDPNVYTFITWVFPFSSAHHHGLKVGDQIVEWDGSELVNLSHQQISQIVSCSGPQAQVILTPFQPRSMDPLMDPTDMPIRRRLSNISSHEVDTSIGNMNMNMNLNAVPRPASAMTSDPHNSLAFSRQASMSRRKLPQPPPPLNGAGAASSPSSSPSPSPTLMFQHSDSLN